MDSVQKQMYIKQAIRLGYNTLIVGPHGIGKTQAVRQWVSQEMTHLKCVYTSLAGMAKDDLITPFPAEIDGEQFVRYLMHEILDDRTPEGRKPIVLVLDEFNRNVTDQQIYNALLEVMSVGSMAGRKVNLHCIVALMNPSDDSRYFNTAELETTVLDRFGLYFRVDGYDMGADEYLLNRYPDTAPGIIEWYLSLPQEKRDLVPPRRQDHILRAYQDGFPIHIALPENTHVPIDQLVDILEGGKVWTVNRLVNHQEEAIQEMKDKPYASYLFFALLRTMNDERTASQMKRLVAALPAHMRMGLLKQPGSVWVRLFKRWKDAGEG